MTYKAFDHEMKCRGFQFEVGQTYTAVGPIKACRNGFHACENPFDLWSYYSVTDEEGRFARYAEVTQSGATDVDGGKVSSETITIVREIPFAEFIRTMHQSLPVSETSGDYAQIGTSGYGARIGSSGDYAQIGTSGYGARIGSSGEYAKVGTSGYGARIGSSGYDARIGSSGDYAQIGSSGEYAKVGSSGDNAKVGSSGYGARIGSSGNHAQIGSSGDYAKIVMEGISGIAACAASATVTAGEGGMFCIPYHDGTRNRFAVAYVGEDGIRPGVAYIVFNGKITPVEKAR